MDWNAAYRVLARLRMETSTKDVTTDCVNHEEAVSAMARNNGWMAAAMYDQVQRRTNSGPKGMWSSSVLDKTNMVALAAVQRTLAMTSSLSSMSLLGLNDTSIPPDIMRQSPISSASVSNNSPTPSPSRARSSASNPTIPPPSRMKMYPCRKWNTGACTFNDDRCFNLHVCSVCWPQSSIKIPAFKHHGDNDNNSFSISNSNNSKKSSSSAASSANKNNKA